jgi:phospholipase/carboxylesterase
MISKSSVAQAGRALAEARAAMILLHGRGATAESMLPLADAFAQPDVAYLAPQAPGRTWYPYSFLAPFAQNEPALSLSLATVGSLVDEIARQGVPRERVFLLGFSQGGCLALDYAVRNARRYGAVAGLSAGLIGPEGTAWDYGGSLTGTPVFLGCSDIDPHIPLARVHESARVLRQIGGAVQEEIYPGMGHTISDAELSNCRRLLAQLVEAVP